MSNNNNLMQLEIGDKTKINNLNDYNCQEMTIKLSKLLLFLIPPLPIFIFIFLFLPLIGFSGLEIAIMIPTLIGIFLICLLSTLLFLWKYPIFIILRKDESNNLLQLQERNVFKKTIKNIMFNLKNIIGDIIIDNNKNEQQIEFESKDLLLVNKCYNININDNFIPSAPEKLFYIYDDVKINEEFNRDKLSEFLDFCPEGENPVFFNALTYMGSSSTDISYYKYSKYIKLSRIMRMNEKFFSYYVEVEPFNLGIYIFYLILINIFLLAALIGLTIYEIYIGTIITSVVLVLSEILLYRNYYKGINEAKRMDIIYSNNFDKLFIGLTNYTEKKYIKTFSLDINSIENFILEKRSRKKFLLKLIYKNKDSIDICLLLEKQSKLEPLLYILNEKIKQI